MTQEKRNKRKTYLKELDKVRASKSEDFEDNFNTFFDSLAVDDVKLETMIDISEAKSLEWNGGKDIALAFASIALSMTISFVLATLSGSDFVLPAVFSTVLAFGSVFAFSHSVNERDSYANLAIELKDSYKEKCASESEKTLSERMVAFAAIKQATVEAEAKLEEVKEALNNVNKKLNNAEAKLEEVNGALNDANKKPNKSN